MLNQNDLKAKIDQVLLGRITDFWKKVPYAKHLIEEDSELNERYYLRHRIETIKRIRLTSRMDALALADIVTKNYDAARLWGKYTIQEMNHDKMFLADLKAHGLSEAAVFQEPLFDSTLRLGDYLEKTLKQEGGIAAVAYSLFVEWNSDRYSPLTVQKAEEKFSEACVKGAKAHVRFDEEHDHYEMVFNIAASLLEKGTSEARLFEIMDDLVGLFTDYFEELYDYLQIAESIKE